MCSARAICTPGQISIQRRDAPAQMCQCAEFRVASSKIHKLEGCHVKEVLSLRQVLLVPLIIGYPNGFCLPLVAIGPKSLSRIRPMLWPAGFEK